MDAVIGFGDMAATADTEMMRARGISDASSRANDRRRLGFLEAQGGGTILLARGDLALKMACWCWAWWLMPRASPTGAHLHSRLGLGAPVPVAGRDSALARSLAKLGVSADDVAVISKHDTSTLANDPNETELHERVGRRSGPFARRPLFVVSQKSLTGHAKGWCRRLPGDRAVPSPARRGHSPIAAGLRRRGDGHRPLRAWPRETPHPGTRFL